MFDHKYSYKATKCGRYFHHKLVFMLRHARLYKTGSAHAYFHPSVISTYSEVFHKRYVRPMTTTAKSNRKVSKGNTVPKKANKRTVSIRDKVPSSGYIGSTNFSLLVPIFEQKLPYLKRRGIKVRDLIDKTIKAHDDLIEHQGVIHGTSRWKSITQYATGVLEGRDPENPGWVAVGKTNKFPKLFGHLLPIAIYVLDNHQNEDCQETVAESRRFLHTMFKLNRVCNSNSDVASLLCNIGTKHPIDPDILAGFERYVRKELGEIRESITPEDLTVGFFLGASNGPNSKPKIHSGLEEAAALVHMDKFSNLFKAVKEYCVITNNNGFLDFLLHCSKKYQFLPSQLTNIKLRKLTAIPDSANKPRVIAICDFWTQSLLAPLESNVLSITRSLFQEKIAYDSHVEGWSKIMEQTPEVRKTLVSLDASSWTDNFPAVLQYITVKAIYGQRLADAWKALAVDCEWYVPNMPRTVKFGKGQGMGTKASFAIAQLTDLLFIGFILGNSTYFIKVGDDLVVSDPERNLVQAYEAIGVPINYSKSKFSTTHGDFIEFVSRNSWNGIDYSIISPTLVSKFLRDDYYCLTLLQHITERQTDGLTLTQLMGHKLDALKSRKNFSLEAFRARLQRLTYYVYLMRGADPDLLNGIEVDLDSLPKLSNGEIYQFVRNLVLVTLGEISYRQQLLTDSINNSSESTVHYLAGLLKEFRVGTPSLIHPGWTEKAFFEAVNSQEFSFEEAILVYRSKIFISKIERKFSSGNTNRVGFQLSPPVLNIGTEDEGLNPQFINEVFKLWESLIDSEINHNVVNRNPFEQRGKQKPLALELFKLVNNAMVVGDDVLNLETCEYKVSADKSVILSPDLVAGFRKLFNIDHTLTELGNNRSFPNSVLLIDTLQNEGKGSK